MRRVARQQAQKKGTATPTLNKTKKENESPEPVQEEGNNGMNIDQSKL